MLDLGPHLRFFLFDLAPGFVQDTAFSQLFLGAAPGGDLPGDFTPGMFGTLLHPGIARIGAYHARLTV